MYLLPNLILEWGRGKRGSAGLFRGELEFGHPTVVGPQTVGAVCVALIYSRYSFARVAHKTVHRIALVHTLKSPRFGRNIEAVMLKNLRRHWNPVLEANTTTNTTCTSGGMPLTSGGISASLGTTAP